MILCSLLNISLAHLYANLEEKFPEAAKVSLSEILKRRMQHEPLQYIQGFTEFYGYHIAVGAGCLIPRPETELLVEHAMEGFCGGAFLDWGTGSGCISVAILGESKSSTCFSVDVSAKALYWAWNNLKLHSLLSRSLLWHSYGLEDIPIYNGSLDLAVANPPYIPHGDMSCLMPEVRIFEPSVALDGGPDGLSAYYPFLKWVRHKLKLGARVLLEVGGTIQAEKLKGFLCPGLSFECVYRDFSNIPRVLCWRRV